MSHVFYDGKVFHKRFKDVEHKFTYPFFMLDIDIQDLASLKNRFFSYNSWNIFSFFTKDHFGNSASFLINIEELLKKFNTLPTKNMRFLTLPRISNFVFNPISVLVLMDEGKPSKMMVEVHNYNGGRIVYPVELFSKSKTQYVGEVQKDMYVSPFLKRDGIYKFTLEYSQEKIVLSVYLYEDEIKTMITSFNAHAKAFSAKNVLALFAKHTFLTFWVVTRTLWQSLRLYLKGLKFNPVTPDDEYRRY